MNPLWLYLRREHKQLENINLAMNCLGNLSLRRDFQLYIATSEIFEKFVDYGNNLITTILKFKQDIEFEILLNYSRVLSNIFINTNNKFLSLNENYLTLLKTLKMWVLKNLKNKIEYPQINDINEDLCLVEAMQFTHNCIF